MPRHKKNMLSKGTARRGRPFFQRGNSKPSQQCFQKSSFRPEFTKNSPKKTQLNETEVGITEFVNESDGFHAIIKARYSDFHVNEINLNNEVAKLDSTSVPKEFHAEAKCVKVAERPTDLIPPDTWTDITNLWKSEDNQVVSIDATSLSKDDRRIIHNAISKAPIGRVVTHTVVDGDKRFITVKRFNKEDKIDRREGWPEGFGPYMHFLVHKEAMDTMEVCMQISDRMRMPASAFTYAGVKDKRAKTTQWFCVRSVNPFKLLRRCHIIKRLHIGNFSFKNEPLKLGQLSGNQFRIALRNVQASDEVIEELVGALKRDGFINYYGLQRFGNDKEVPTYEIGKQLLLGNWKEACSLILKPKKSDNNDCEVTEAKRVFDTTQDAAEACKCFNLKRNKCVEAKLLSGIAKSHSNDYVTALECIPRNMRLLYIHSFQSFIWNKMASIRFQQFGAKPVVGDLVLLKNDVLLNDEPDCDDNVAENTDDNKEETKLVKVLQEEDLSNYTAYDIVLPLPGYDIVYPENLKLAYKEVLEEHGLTLEMPKQKVRTYSLSGTYRKLFGEVKDLTWKVMYYNDQDYSLIRSDWEELQGDEEPKSIEGGQFKALILNFSLSPSNYATMVLRELLKCDTSGSYQAKLNHKVNKDSEPVDSSVPDLKRPLHSGSTADEHDIPSKCRKIEEKENAGAECLDETNTKTSGVGDNVQEDSVMVVGDGGTDVKEVADKVTEVTPSESGSGASSNDASDTKEQI